MDTSEIAILPLSDILKAKPLNSTDSNNVFNLNKQDAGKNISTDVIIVDSIESPFLIYVSTQHGK